MNLKSENKMEVDKTEISQTIDMLTTDKIETVEIVVNSNGCKDKFDSASQRTQNQLECLKQSIVQIVKLDYK